MALPTSYMTGNYTKFPQYFETILNAQAPEKFTVKFLKDLGFTSSTDLQFINVLKSLGFLEDSGAPTELYYRLFDRSESKKLIAAGIRKSYADLFALNVNAQNMSREELKGKFKTLTSGQKSDSTLKQMVSTFIGLCQYAEWTDNAENIPSTEKVSTTGTTKEVASEENAVHLTGNPVELPKSFDLNYDIHIHLPATRDPAVYDALFASLAKHIPLK